MKKFVFTNEKYHGIKEREFEKLKLDMANLNKQIELAMATLAGLQATFMAEGDNFAAACREGVSAGEMMNYQGYFEYLKEEIEEAKKKLAQLVRRKQEMTAALTRINNELKVLEDMKAEQYQAYLKEVAKDEAKELDSIMSFNIFEKAV